MTKPQAKALQATDPHSDNTPVVGRPTSFNEATASIICNRIAEGETLMAICRTPGIPTKTTVHRWRRKFPQFRADYALARVDQMETWSDQCIEISDDDTLDTMQSTDKQGNSIQVANHANVQRDRLRVDTRKFIMGKIAPRIYGEMVKHEHEHTGEVNYTVQLSDRERMRRLATFMVEDKRAGVTIDQAASPMVTAPASQSPAKPSDIVNGTAQPKNDDDV